MAFLHNLKLWLSPLRMTDPDFGNLLFMHISRWPERSYWECEWNFPKTGTVVSIALPGGESGPLPEARQFYLSLPARYDQILAECRPRLEKVFNDWLNVCHKTSSRESSLQALAWKTRRNSQSSGMLVLRPRVMIGSGLRFRSLGTPQGK